MRKTIHLDSRVRRKIVDLLKVHDLLLQHRNARLGRVSAILYGVAIASGFWLVMGFIRGGEFDLAPFIFWLLAVSWLSAGWIDLVEKAKPMKINIKP